MIYILWLIVIIFSLISIVSLVVVFNIAISFFREAPYVPLEKESIKYAISLLEVVDGDRFIDIGCGDGRVVVTAANITKGVARYTGLDISKTLVFISKLHILFSKHRENINIVLSDAITFDYSQYNKVFMYLTTPLASQVLKHLPKNTRVVSAYFPVKIDDPDMRIEVRKHRIKNRVRNFYIITT